MSDPPPSVAPLQSRGILFLFGAVTLIISAAFLCFGAVAFVQVRPVASECVCLGAAHSLLGTLPAVISHHQPGRRSMVDPLALPARVLPRQVRPGCLPADDPKQPGFPRLHGSGRCGLFHPHNVTGSQHDPVCCAGGMLLLSQFWAAHRLRFEIRTQAEIDEELKVSAFTPFANKS